MGRDLNGNGNGNGGCVELINGQDLADLAEGCKRTLMAWLKRLNIDCRKWLFGFWHFVIVTRHCAVVRLR